MHINFKKLNCMLTFCFALFGAAALLSSSFTLLYFLKYRKASKALEDLQHKFKISPSYETQLFMADMLRSGVLFHIERLPPEDVLIRRG